MTTPPPSGAAAGQDAPDPHGTRYDCERADLALGHLSDDHLANAAYMFYDVRPPLQDIIDGKAHSPIAYMTAVKDRIRWLSRRVAALTRTPSPSEAQPVTLRDDVERTLAFVVCITLKEYQKALRRLALAARTSGGTAGPDAELMAACDEAERILAAPPSPHPAPSPSEGVREAVPFALCTCDTKTPEVSCHAADCACRRWAESHATPDELDADRLRWLHSQASCTPDAEGYEWGVYRVRWENGQAVSVLATLSDSSDLDAVRAALASSTVEETKRGEG